MSRYFNRIFVIGFLFVVSFFLVCTLPQDPRENPDALKAEVIIPDTITSIYVGKQVTFAVKVHYPMNAKKITAIVGDGIGDSVIILDKPPQTDEATWYFICTFNTSGTNRKFTVELQASDDNIKRYYSRAFDVLAKKFQVAFETVPANHLVEISKADTMVFTARTEPAGSAIKFSAHSQPTLDSNSLLVIDENSRARVIVIPKENKNYMISCYAHSATEHDTATVELTTYQPPIIKASSGKDTLKAGSVDTLLFTNPSGTTEALVLTLLNQIDTNVIKVLQTKQDSIQIVFKPDSIKTYLFSIQVKKGNLLDTITISKVITGNPLTIWKQLSATANATEGKQLLYEFSSFLTDSNRTAVMLTSSKGTIDNKVVKYSIPWGSVPKDSIMITSTFNGVVSQFKLILNVVPADSSAPILKLIAPATNPSKTNDTKVTCKFTAVDSGAGISAVLFTRDGTVISDTNRTDNLYSCNISNLVHGVPVTVKMVVTDGSMKKNRDSITITITRDSTLEDKAGPKFTIVSDPRKDGRVLVDTGTIIVSIEDASGIADNGISAKLNGTSIIGITKNSSSYSIPYKLQHFGQNSIKINATDNSASKNSDSVSLKVDYNTKPSGITLVSPSTNAQEIDTFPLFKWTGGSDIDGDSVFFKVIYGTSETSLLSQSAELFKTNEVNLFNKLTLNTIYYWKVIGYTKGTHNDTVTSGVYYFKTVNPDRIKPQIELINPTTYTPEMRETALTGTIIVKITDANGIDSVWYSINNGQRFAVTGSGPTYTINYTFPKHGVDTIKILVTDKSTEHNLADFSYIVTCNAKLTEQLVSIAPDDARTEIDTCPTFTWEKLIAADYDSIYYRIIYSTFRDFTLNNGTQSSEVRDTNRVTLPVIQKLQSNTDYYYKVIAYTKTPFKDTVLSELKSFKTFNRKPEVVLVSPENNTIKIDPVSGTFNFSAEDPEDGTLRYTVIISDSIQNIVTPGWRLNNLSSASFRLSDFTGRTFTHAKRYYWLVIATDNGTVKKSDTSDVFNFYTINRAPIWATIPSKDSTYYNCTIDISKFCSDPENHTVSYRLLTNEGVTLNGTIVSCVSDSQEITVQAIDSFPVQPCTSSTTFRRSFRNPQMKLIDAKNRTFTMGMPGVAMPVHDVMFTYHFFMDSTEVTQGDYLDLMSKNPSFYTGDLRRPVETVNWYDAVLYCNARSKRDGLDTVYSYTRVFIHEEEEYLRLDGLIINRDKFGYRLPNEAEFEYAARGGTKYRYYWGDDTTMIDIYEWFKEVTMQPVATKKANAFQLFDMVGNVREWCNDRARTNYIDSTLVINPIGPEPSNTGGGFRIQRGGNSGSKEELYSAFRNEDHSETYSKNCGFRVVLQKK